MIDFIGKIGCYNADRSKGTFTLLHNDNLLAGIIVVGCKYPLLQESTGCNSLINEALYMYTSKALLA